MMKLRIKAFLFGFYVFCISTWYRKKGKNFIFHFFTKFFLFVCGSIFASWKGRIGISLYLYIRRIDDIVDEDTSPPSGYTIDTYISRKNETVNHVLNGSEGSIDCDEILLLHILEESRVGQIDIRNWLKDIWEVFLFDYTKRKFKRAVPREKLIEMASKQDVALLSILGSLGIKAKNMPGRFEKLQEKTRSLRGFATRQDWLVDLFYDLSIGSINIPQEVLSKSGVPLEQIVQCKTKQDLLTMPDIYDWYVEETREMAEYWKKAEEFLPELIEIFDSYFIRSAILTLYSGWKKDFEIAMFE